MRSIAAALALAALPAVAPSADAANVPAPMIHPDSVVSTAQERQYRPQRDCTPYNGPFGFYGNVWCQPPNEQSRTCATSDRGGLWKHRRRSGIRSHLPTAPIGDTQR